MSFASPIFLWYFLPVVLLATWIAPNRARNGIVAVASLIFYALGAGPTTLLLLSCIALNFAAGIALDRADLRERPELRRPIAYGAVAVNLLALGVWKYAGFASEQIHNLSRVLGLGDTPTVAIALPIGISFYTFHQISYVIDVYRRDRSTQYSALTYVTYVAMFPQLIAGPIVRYGEIADQLAERKTSRWDDLADGFPRFCLGLAKKVIIADSIAPFVQTGFSTPANELSTTAAWLIVIAYSIQLYFDFSGYSDMAIGLGRMLGFQLPENFNRPYSAHSITDFWRRWHMSLSRWFRDYVYIPLGGNRHGAQRTYLNLWIVFILVGFWHGANWTFLVWGAFHGSLLIIEKSLGVSVSSSGLNAIARRAGVLVLVMIGWVFFRADSLGSALSLLGRMFSLHTGEMPLALSEALTNQRLFWLVVGAIVFLIPRDFVTGVFLQFSDRRAAIAARLGYSSVAVTYAGLLVAAGTFSPFLYYQF